MKPLITRLLILCIVVGGCSKADNASKSPETAGKGGSLAKFTIAGNFLYVVNDLTLHVYDISDSKSPRHTNDINIGFLAETIFPFADRLFIGSRDGMFIYSLEDASNPQKLGEARHLRSCDPVVANDSVSYVTLRGGTACGPAEDGLYIYDIKYVQAPVQKSFLSLSRPLGLGLKDTVLFVCREDFGLTAVNVKDINQPKVMYTLETASFRDVIPYDDLLICYTSTGLLLYDISDLNNITEVGASKF